MKNKSTTIYKLPTTDYRLRGLALIELIIAFSIIGLVSILVATVYFAHSRLFSTQNTSIEVASQNRLALDEMTNQIREAVGVISSCCSPTETTGANVLVLQIWPIDSSGEPFEPTTGDHDFIVYKRDPADNTKLIKKIIPDPDASPPSQRQVSEKIIASNISALTFTYEPDNNDPPTATTVIVSVTTTGQSNAKTLTSMQTAKAVLRNK